MRASISVVSWWRLGENDPSAIAGGNAIAAMDTIGSDNLSYSTNALYSSDVAASANAHVDSTVSVNFQSSGGYATGNLVSTAQDNFGVEAWVKPTAVTTNQTIVYNGNTATSGWGLRINGDNSTYCALFGGVDFFGSSPAVSNDWVHVALVRDNGIATLYVNGLAAGTTTLPPNIPTGTFAIGAPPQNPASQPFSGLVDEVRVFTFAPGQFSLKDLLLNQTPGMDIYFGQDVSPYPPVPLGPNDVPVPVYTNSQRVASQFLHRLALGSTESFEGLSTGSSPTELQFGTGTNIATVSGTPVIYTMLDPTTAIGGGFAITGTNYIWLDTSIDNFGSFTVTFDNPQGAFGFYGMDIEFNEFTVVLHYADGSSKLLQVPVTVPQGSGGVFYFGVVDPEKPFTAVEFQDTGSDDAFFFDNLTVADAEHVLPPQLNIRGSPIELSWDTVTNKIYQLQCASSLINNTWVPIGAPVIGDGSPFSTNIEVRSGQQRAFYRFASIGSPVLPPPVMGRVDATTLCQGEANSWYARASIKRLGDGSLVLVYYHASGHAANDGALHIRFSIDNGATWTEEDTYIDGSAVGGFPMNPSGALTNPQEDAGEPWLMIAPNGDLLVHMWCVNYTYPTAHGTYQSRSTDGGRTWTTSAQVQWNSPDSDDYIFSTDDDFVLDGVIFIEARVYTDPCPTQCRTIFADSDDNGVTWREVSNVSNYGLGEDTCEAGMAYVGNNTIVTVLRSLDDVHTYTTRSTNMGLTWAPLTDITSSLPNAGRARIRTHSYLMGLTNWWNDPVLIMNGFTKPDSGPMATGYCNGNTVTNLTVNYRQNAVWVSLDQGVTWLAPFYVDSPYADGGYGDVFWDPVSQRYAFVSYISSNPPGFSGNSSLIQYKFHLFNLPDCR